MSARNRYLDNLGSRRELSINTASLRQQQVSYASSRWTGRSTGKLRAGIAVALGTPLFFYFWLIIFSERVGPAYVSPDLLTAQRILWLIAHPDDESMFFAPSIYNLLGEHDSPNGTEVRPTGHILSLSAGNAEGLGKQRQVELRASCLAFGIQPDHCITLDQDTLPDSMTTWWDEKVIEYWTRAHIERWNIDLIITFDEDGVSGHANHRAIHASMVKAANLDLNFPIVFTLRSTRSAFMKYSSLFSYLWDPDMHPIAAQKHPFLPEHPVFTKAQLSNGYAHPFSSHPSLLVNSPVQYLKSRTAFKQHKSQNVWFRKLYMFASRYMWFNELFKVVRVHERVVDLGKIREKAKSGL